MYDCTWAMEGVKGVSSTVHPYGVDVSSDDALPCCVRSARFPLAMGWFPSVQSELKPCVVHSLHVSKPLQVSLSDYLG